MRQKWWHHAHQLSCYDSVLRTIYVTMQHYEYAAPLFAFSPCHNSWSKSNLQTQRMALNILLPVSFQYLEMKPSVQKLAFLAIFTIPNMSQCLSLSLVTKRSLNGRQVVTKSSPNGHHSVTYWLPSGRHVVTKWLPNSHSSHQVVTKWSPCGHQVVT